MTTQDKLIKKKLSLLELSEFLHNVSEAWEAEILSIPSACASCSILRVDTPLIKASWT